MHFYQCDLVLDVRIKRPVENGPYHKTTFHYLISTKPQFHIFQLDTPADTEFVQFRHKNEIDHNKRNNRLGYL